MNLELIIIRGGMTEELTKAPMTTKKPIFEWLFIIFDIMID